jgi:hypothetical protein
MGNGTLYVHRLTAANADWTDNGTFGLRNGAAQWAGGESGALAADTDYNPTVLAQLDYENNPTGGVNPVGHTYDLVIPGSLATNLINQWARAESMKDLYCGLSASRPLATRDCFCSTPGQMRQN